MKLDYCIKQSPFASNPNMSLVAIFIVLNIITAIKIKNLEAKEEIHKNFDDYIKFQHGLNVVEKKTESTKNNKVLAILKNDAEDSAKIENIISSHKIKRSAIEENEASPKPIRRVRHRGNLKQDLKAGEVNTTAQSDLRNEEVTKLIKSNTNTFEDRDDNATNKMNIALNNNFINTYLDINRDLLMRTMELNRLANRNKTLLNNEPISSVVQNENMKSKGIIVMPSKYISVVKDPNTMMPNAKDEIMSFDNRTPKEEIIKKHNSEIVSEQYDQEPYLLYKNPLKTNETVYQNVLNAKRLYGHIENKEINDAGFVLEQNIGYFNQPYNMYQTLSREKQGDDNYNKEDMNRRNMKTLGTNGRNVYHKFYGARPRFNDRQLMGRSGAGFDEEEYYDDYSDYTYPKLRQGKVDDYQGMMEDSGATFETAQYEGYPNQPNIYQKLLRARQEYNRHEHVEDNRDGLRTYQNHPNDIHQKLLGVSQRYNQKEPMERDETRILTEPYHDGPYGTNIKSLERPNFEQEPLERERNSAGLMGEQYRKENLHHPSNEPRPRFDQKDLVERNDARIQPLASPTVPSHTQEYDIRLDHQELMESKGHANIEDHYIRGELNDPNMKYFDRNGHNIHKKLLETRPRFDNLEPIAASDKKEAGQHEKGPPPNTKASEINRNTHQNLTEAKPIFDHPYFKESKNNEILDKAHINVQNNQLNDKFLETGSPNIIKTKERSDQENLVKDHSESFQDQFEETNQKIAVPHPIIYEPDFEDLRKPTQEVIERNISDIVAEHYNEDFHLNMKAQDNNPKIYKYIPETARLGPENMAIKEADTRYYAESEHLDEPNVIPFENNNNYPDSFKERNALYTTVEDIAKSIHLDEKEKGTLGIHPRLVQVTRIQPLVVLPRFGCRLVPVCTRFYLRKRCPKTIIKCGLF